MVRSPLVHGHLASSREYNVASALLALQGNGAGCISIYGTKFADEESGLAVRHGSAGMLSSANSGQHSNGCQFFITCAPCSWLDGKHVVFGRCLDDESMLVMRKIEATATDTASPGQAATVLIADCGQL
jgi:peptidyl-prolyl isomerase H (cyclophilin H)